MTMFNSLSSAFYSNQLDGEYGHFLFNITSKISELQLSIGMYYLICHNIQSHFVQTCRLSRCLGIPYCNACHSRSNVGFFESPSIQARRPIWWWGNSWNSWNPRCIDWLAWIMSLAELDSCVRRWEAGYANAGYPCFLTGIKARQMQVYGRSQIFRSRQRNTIRCVAMDPRLEATLIPTADAESKCLCSGYASYPYAGDQLMAEVVGIFGSLIPPHPITDFCIQ